MIQINIRELDIFYARLMEYLEKNEIEYYDFYHKWTFDVLYLAGNLNFTQIETITYLKELEKLNLCKRTYSSKNKFIEWFRLATYNTVFEEEEEEEDFINN